ncbi:Na+/H+ antiporter NhaC [Spongorhabdus nitratireducens]
MPQTKLPSSFQIILLLALFLSLTFSFTSLLDLPIQLALFIGWCPVVLLGLHLGHTYQHLESAAMNGISRGLGAVFILLAVGALTGSWLTGGVVPAIIYYGLDILDPSLFLPMSVLLCAAMALVTGTSWGAAGTAGIAVMSMGEGLNIPAPLCAGAVLSGIYFGDKLSPLSDSVLLASSMSGVEIVSHIRGMLPISLISMAITLLIFAVVGFEYNNELNSERIVSIRAELESYFNLTPATLIPIIPVVVLLARRNPALPVMALGAFLGILWGIWQQHLDPSHAVQAAWNPITPDHLQFPLIADLLEKGGMERMLGSLVVIVLGLGFGSLLESIGVVTVIANYLQRMTQSEAGLTSTTLLTGFLGNLFGSAMYVSLILTPRLLIGSYDRINADRRLLSRNTEFGGTLTSGMVPWSDNGIFMTAVLGVPTMMYLPYMWLSWVCIGLTLIFAWLQHLGIAPALMQRFSLKSP